VKKSIGPLAVLALSAGLLFAAIAPAFAHDDETTTAGSTVSMNYKAAKHKVVGLVVSTDSRCASDRKVTVYKVTRRGRTPVGSAKTNDAGLWRVSLASASGKYAARVAPKSITLASGSDQYGNLWEHVLECASATTSLKI
jgi:hypothetical protein